MSRAVTGTGGGFVYRAMKPEFCPAHYLPNHCFVFDLESDGGAWLDAPYWMPAGSTVKVKDGYDYWIASSHAYRDGGAL